MRIRPLQYADLAQYEELAVASFGRNNNTFGEGEAEIRKQFKLMRFGRMIPFKIILALGNTKTKILLAEHDGDIVGSATYSVRRGRATISGLMVANNFRNQGIAATLIAECEAEIARFDIGSVQANIAFENVASRRVFEKRGFHLFSHQRCFEGTIRALSTNNHPFTVRQSASTDKDDLQQLISLCINDSKQINALSDSFLAQSSSLMRSLGRLGGYERQVRLIENELETCGVYRLDTSRSQNLAHIYRLFVTNVVTHLLPAMLATIVENHPQLIDWKIKVSLFAQQTQLIDWFTNQDNWREQEGETTYRKSL